MITYELAKQLKEKGFPDTEQYLYSDEGSICGIPEKLHTKKRCDDWDCHIECIEYPNPNLSELIDACPKTTEDENEEFTLAYRPDKWIAGYFGYDVFMSPTEYGSTPEEAVANLWLEINK